MAECRKRCYRTRKYARQKLREFRGQGLEGAQGPVHVYWCSACGFFHLGHHGKRSRAEMGQELKKETDE